jgi:hypothetical protein
VKPSRRLATVVLVTAALLTACGSQAGAASVVGDRTISDKQVADYTAELKTQMASIERASYDEAKATQTAVSVLTRNAVLTEVAARENITVTQGDVDAFLETVIAADSKGDRKTFYDSLARDNFLPESVVAAAARTQLVVNAIVKRIAPDAADDARSKALTDYLTPLEKEIGVEVSPRFGTWNVLTLGPSPQDLSIIPGAAAGAAVVPPAS